MASEKTDAIVIRMVEFSETSLIVTLYSRDFGRISAIAKGARRPKGPFEGAIDLLSVCHIEVLRKAGDTLDLLTEAKLARRSRAAQKSLDRLYCGYYIAEMLQRWTDDGDPHPDFYDLALSTIERVDSQQDHLMAITYFEVRAMRMLGHAPATKTCVMCGAEVSRSPQRIPFGHEVGGVLCPGCQSRHRGVAMIDRNVLGWMDRLNEAEVIPDEPFSYETYRQIRALLNRYIRISLGSRPRTQSMLPTKLAAH
ncbi:MAG: DNA repair protein RecO [Planctomycetaceae bacterium]